MLRQLVPYLPGLLLNVGAGVLYSRAGYGPFGDAAQRDKPCQLTRCVHNAMAVHAAGLAWLAVARWRAQKRVAVSTFPTIYAN